MRKLLEGNSFIFTAGILVAIVGVTALVILGLGRAYKGGLDRFTNTQTPEEIILTKTKKIKSISIRKQNQSGCIHVTPDGIVRVYETCDETLDEAHRLNDPRNILKLFKLVQEGKLSTYQQGDGEVYVITVETDEGTQQYYIVVNEGTPGGSGEIIDTVEDIEEDIPNPSPSNGSSTSASTVPGSSTVLTPSPSLPPGSSPLPSPSPSIPPFECDFSDSRTGPKPYNVSNIICSTEPSSPPY